jgi:hypothetical protein
LSPCPALMLRLCRLRANRAEEGEEDDEPATAGRGSVTPLDEEGSVEKDATGGRPKPCC